VDGGDGAVGDVGLVGEGEAGDVDDAPEVVVGLAVGRVLGIDDGNAVDVERIAVGARVEVADGE
jgi:hypothetical protein